MKTDPYYDEKKDNSGSVEFSDAQIVYKFARRMTSNLDFKVTVFNIKYPENSTKQNRAIITMEGWYEVVYHLSKDVIFSDLE